MPNVTTEKAVQNQVASAKMEGIHFNCEALNLIRKYADNEISHEELVEIVAQMCAEIS
ncbi:MAG: antitoxin VbhA family protein [Ruminococcus sp.]|nr:antitoxin VbhA family protein [Ruminococcus sp.]